MEDEEEREKEARVPWQAKHQIQLTDFDGQMVLDGPTTPVAAPEAQNPLFEL